MTHFMTPNSECVCLCVGVNFIFRACTMPVQPDRAEPVIAESGNSAKDTVSAQLHRNAGKEVTHTHVHTHTHTHTHRSLYSSGSDGGVSV